MIIARSPLRISLGGGGTDLPSYYSRFGGALVAAAIDKYVYIVLHRTFEPELILKYSKMERVKRADDVQHPLFRESLKLLGLDEPSLEIASVADIPDGTGLGSSGSFTTALLRALHAYRRDTVQAPQLAEEACEIEMGRLKEPVGKQDPYIAAFGGLTSFRFHPDGRVEARPLRVPSETLHRLEDNFLLFFTGFTRSASSILREQDDKSRSNDAAMIENLHEVKALGQKTEELLMAGDLAGYAELMNVHWEKKKERSPGMTNPRIDAWYRLARDNGALGGKLVGAGGGGFLLFYTEDPARLRRALESSGLQEVRFRFDFEGTRLLTSA
jgi:D-glycero-alpha-D-manno-heptose-7-phosphate kinase